MAVVPPAPPAAAAAAAAADDADDAAGESPPWVPRAWFGGAMRASLPPSFLDASAARPVPDHQEMWHEGRGDPGAALLVEVVEHDAAVADGAAGRHFFSDAAEGAGAIGAGAGAAEGAAEGAGTGSGSAGSAAAGGGAFEGREGDASGGLPAPRMPGGRPTAAYEGAFVVPSGGGGGGGGGGVVAAALAVFRVPRVGSDIVVTSFEPAGALESSGADGSAARRAAAAAAAGAPLAAARGRLARVLATMSVEDWGLFGGGGGDDEAAAAG